MFALDRLKVVMPLEHVTVLNESVFNATTRHGEILKLNYSQKVPALLNIKIDYENSQYLIVRHSEKNNPHSHCILNMVDNDGNRLKDLRSKGDRRFKKGRRRQSRQLSTIL